MGRLTKDALNAAPFWNTPPSLTLASIPNDKRLDDTATGYLALCAKVKIITKRSLEKYRFNFERDGKLRATHLNTGQAFLGPDNLPLKVDRRSLCGSTGNKPHESKYTLDSVHLHPQYQNWLEKTLSAEDLAPLPSNPRTHPRKSHKNASSTLRITQTAPERLQKSRKDVHSTLGITKTVTGSLKEIIQLKAENAAVKAELKSVKEETALIYEAVNNADVKTNQYIQTTAECLINNIRGSFAQLLELTELNPMILGKIEDLFNEIETEFNGVEEKLNEDMDAAWDETVKTKGDTETKIDEDKSSGNSMDANVIGMDSPDAEDEDKEFLDNISYFEKHNPPMTAEEERIRLNNLGFIAKPQAIDAIMQPQKRSYSQAF